jgi:hypothetical protein
MVRLPGGYRKAIKIAAWLKKQGLVHEVDYTWHCMYMTGECVFAFKDESNESLMLMRWIND